MNKTKSMRVRLTETEWQQAETASISLFGTNNKSRFLRKLMRDYIGMGPDLTDKELNEFRDAVRQLTGIARNLNQITARINNNSQELKHVPVDYLKRVEQSVIALNDELKSYISNTITRYQKEVDDE
ncbi:plasmid mobilization relaxosome protein MobC [Legionella lytica]|uniref:Plasmid mobilization relaxosome protein MobC n=1 Tax=Legionella lytica TaxID=96232 RepID=A0ABW8DBB3_9GAMM